MEMRKVSFLSHFSFLISPFITKYGIINFNSHFAR